MGTCETRDNVIPCDIITTSIYQTKQCLKRIYNTVSTEVWAEPSNGILCEINISISTTCFEIDLFTYYFYYNSRHYPDTEKSHIVFILCITTKQDAYSGRTAGFVRT